MLKLTNVVWFFFFVFNKKTIFTFNKENRRRNQTSRTLINHIMSRRRRFLVEPVEVIFTVYNSLEYITLTSYHNNQQRIRLGDRNLRSLLLISLRLERFLQKKGPFGPNRGHLFTYFRLAPHYTVLSFPFLSGCPNSLRVSYVYQYLTTL